VLLDELHPVAEGLALGQRDLVVLVLRDRHLHERVDAALGTLLAALPEKATVLVTSDHGGHDRAHGSEMPEDMTIPWLIAGPGIRAGHEIQAPVSVLDTAPTLARVLGLQPDRQWEGRCPEEIWG
jgi:arylsulfatase A-like enzyme